ncbi:MAG: pyruvate carboxylase [Anaerocolumna sp.]|nr:pyruvate carboxylase [Anaerocolumna sp.]
MYIIELEGKKYAIDVKDDYAELVLVTETSKSEEFDIYDNIPDFEIDIEDDSNSDTDEIVAMMPGTVLSINVQEGDRVKKGDSLLVFETMKMESNIAANKDAIINRVLIREGDQIYSGMKLFSFTPVNRESNLNLTV